MKDYFICQSSSNNYYSLNLANLYHLYIPKELLYFICKSGLIRREEVSNFKKALKTVELSKEEYDYYQRKFVFLLKNGLIKDCNNIQPNKFNGKIESNLIKIRLINLTNLVFEVTNHCNMKCTYCAYGDLYDNVGGLRNNLHITFKLAKAMIDYLVKYWKLGNLQFNRKIVIGFYGGEPLLNMNTIKEIINYIEVVTPKNIHFDYFMTTNGTLLNEYIDYLYQKKFNLLISLDGNKSNNCYRILKSNSNSYDIIYNNIKLIQLKYPEYFSSNINFNAILHDKNSLREIIDYFKIEFNKIPNIAELNTNNLNFNKEEVFKSMYKSITFDLENSSNYSEITKSLKVNNPEIKNAVSFVHRYSGNVYKSYADFFQNFKTMKFVPTSTCLPFEKKLYLTVNGKIMPCERISHKHIIGEIINNRVCLNLKDVSVLYNQYYKYIKGICEKCYRYSACQQCLFNFKNISSKSKCKYFLNYATMRNYLSKILSLLENDRVVYASLLKAELD